VIALGDTVLAATFLNALPIDPLWLALAGMAVIAIGAALVQAQLSGGVVALAPPTRAGMASALTIVMRQGGFAVGIAGPRGHDRSRRRRRFDGFARSSNRHWLTLLSACQSRSR
jgi:hypothetical protein